MKKRSLILGSMVGALVLAFAMMAQSFVSAQSASGTETAKLINVLRVDSNGAAFVAVQNPGPSQGCGFSVLSIGTLNNDGARATYSTLLAAKLSGTPVTIVYNNCTVASVSL